MGVHQRPKHVDNRKRAHLAFGSFAALRVRPLPVYHSGPLLVFLGFVKYSSVSVYFYECTTRGKSWQKQNNYPCASDINNVIYLVFHKIVNIGHQLLV